MPSTSWSTTALAPRPTPWTGLPARFRQVFLIGPCGLAVSGVVRKPQCPRNRLPTSLDHDEQGREDAADGE